ncbi:MAG: methylenetetrahydrofolate reductase [Hyphomicrobiaceae bacterium]
MTSKNFNISFEIFPARSEDAERQMTQTLERLAVFDPAFISVTYGAGGSSTDRTITTIERVRRQHATPIAGHLTTIGQTRAETGSVIARYRQMGVKHIVALRGDTGPGIKDNPEGHADAAELVSAIRKQEGPSERSKISVAAYPDAHPASPSKAADVDNLVAKFDAGADQAISQFFFMNAPFLRLRDKLARRGVDKPLVAGILPVNSFAQTRRMARRCKTRIPRYISRGFKHVANDDELSRMFAISLAVEQIDNLIAEGVRDFHFYTLNRADLTHTICGLIGSEAEAALRGDTARIPAGPLRVGTG